MDEWIEWVIELDGMNHTMVKEWIQNLNKSKLSELHCNIEYLYKLLDKELILRENKGFNVIQEKDGGMRFVCANCKKDIKTKQMENSLHLISCNCN